MKNNLSIHSFEHAPFEGLGCIGDWAGERSHRLSSTSLYNNEQLPDLKKIDWLVIMGGPMSIHNEKEFPWLKAEKIFIRKAIEANKTVIGICLGAQLVAHVLGAKIYKNPQTEIGWFDVVRTEESYLTDLLTGFDKKMKVFHWHGDTFELPDGAISLFQSVACKNQGFLFRNNVLLWFGFSKKHSSVMADLHICLALSPPSLQRLNTRGNGKMESEVIIF